LHEDRLTPHGSIDVHGYINSKKPKNKLLELNLDSDKPLSPDLGFAEGVKNPKKNMVVCSIGDADDESEIIISTKKKTNIPNEGKKNNLKFMNVTPPVIDTPTNNSINIQYEMSSACERIETMESNCSEMANLSPRSKDMRKLIKIIRLTFK
jgi:hypothetical protein